MTDHFMSHFYLLEKEIAGIPNRAEDQQFKESQFSWEK